MSENKKIEIKCSNGECGKTFHIPSYCDETHLENEDVSCPHCKTINSCSMENMRTSTD